MLNNMCNSGITLNKILKWNWLNRRILMAQCLVIGKMVSLSQPLCPPITCFCKFSERTGWQCCIHVYFKIQVFKTQHYCDVISFVWVNTYSKTRLTICYRPGICIYNSGVALDGLWWASNCINCQFLHNVALN